MKRPFTILGFSYFITLAVLNFISLEFVPIVFWILLALTLFSLFFKKLRQEKILPVSFFTCLVATTVFFINYNFRILPVQKFDEQDLKIHASICDLVQKSNNKFNYTLNVKSVNDNPVRNFKIIMQSPSAIDCDLYDDFTGNIHMYIPKNTPAFDTELYYRAKSIYAKAFLYDYQIYNVKKPDKLPFYYYILKLRQSMLSSSKKILPTKIASVVNGIILGEKSEIPQEIKTSFTDTGIYHILATSGIHISILTQFLIWFLRKLKLKEKFVYLFSAAFVLIFMALTCFTPSVMRAGIMTIVYLVGLAIFRSSDSLNSLGIAVFVICVFSPNSACNIGLWLSFLSTLGIIVLYEPIYKFLKNIFKKYENSKILNYITSNISVSLAVECFTLPVLAWYFKKISVLFLISNLTMLYLVPFVIIFGLIANLFNLLAAPAFLIYPFVFVCAFSVNLLINISKVLSDFPFATISLSYGAINFWLACVLFLAAVGIYARNTQKAFKLIFLISLNLALVGIVSYQILNCGRLLVEIIPCGNGSAVMLSKNSRQVCIICLDENTYMDSLNGYFSSSSIKNIDYLNLPVISNFQKTDAISLIDNQKPATLIVPIENSENLDFENNKTKAIYFDGNLKSKLWNEFTIENYSLSGNIYIRVCYKKVKFLIFPTGGNVNDLPSSWKVCDFVICHGLPINYNYINSKNIILSMNKKDSEISIAKMYPKDKIVFSATHQGPVYVNINSAGNYQIRRMR